MKQFLLRGARILGVLLSFLGIVLYFTLQGVMYKGEYAESISRLRSVSQFAEAYRESEGIGYEGLCEHEVFLKQRDLIEAIDRTGILNWSPYTVRCIADTEQYAVSMSSYVDLLGNKTPYGFLCVSSQTGNELLEQHTHITESRCVGR